MPATKVTATDADRDAYDRARGGPPEAFSSSSVSELAYDAESGTAFVRWLASGKLYFYLDVPAGKWEAIRAGASKGKSVNDFLRGQYHYGEL